MITRENAQLLLPIIKAYSEGKEIEFLNLGDKWQLLPDPSFDGEPFQYRIKPEPKAVELLLQQESFSNDIWEPASGENHIANVLIKKGYNVKTSDIIKRLPTTEEYDFLSIDNTQLWGGRYYN